MKKLICFSILTLTFGWAMGQSQYIVLGEEPEAKCINKQEKKLLKEFKKTKCFRSLDDLNFLFIYTYSFKARPSPELFLKGVAAEELKILYRKKKNFPISYAIIFNQEQEVIGNAEESNIFCYYESLLAGRAYEMERKLLDYKSKKLPDRIFRIDATPSNLYFAEKDKELNVLLFDKDYKMKVLEMREFIECCWEESFPKQILEIHYPK